MRARYVDARGPAFIAQDVEGVDEVIRRSEEDLARDLPGAQAAGLIVRCAHPQHARHLEGEEHATEQHAHPSDVPQAMQQEARPPAQA